MEGAGAANAFAVVNPRPHVVLLPTPATGHLIPMAALARRLVAVHGLEVTFLICGHNPSRAPFLSTFPAGVHVESLPPPNLDDVPKTAKPETRMFLTVSRSVPALRNALSRIYKLVAVVVDFFGTDAFEAAREAGADPYIFFPTNAHALSLFFQLPVLDHIVGDEYLDMLQKPLKLPGCMTLEWKDLPGVIHDREDDVYKGLLRQCRQYSQAKGIVINTFEGIEPRAAKALQDWRQHLPDGPTIYPVGPLISQVEDVVDRATCPCLRWLDQQPAGSVVYVSFGSGGTLSMIQMEELVAGLEMSGQRFLWVARPPRGAVTYGADNAGDDLWFLPKGFRERTKEVGLVVSAWAPQVAVLAHEATGGFLTHCGWNSTLEALTHGVPLIAWPLYAEQKMNAIILEQDVGVAIRPTSDSATGGVVGREEVSRVLNELMEGEEGKRLRSAAGKIQKAAESAFANDGKSTEAFGQVVEGWRRRVTAITKTAALRGVTDDV